MRRMISTVMAISVLIGMVGLISPTYAQLNLSVWQDLREKEDKFSNTTFIWEAEVFSESNPTALPDEVLDRIRTQGGIVPPSKPYKFAKTVKLTIRRNPSFITVSGDWPVINTDTLTPDLVRFQTFWSTKFCGDIDRDVHDRIYVVEVASTPSHSYRHWNPVDRISAVNGLNFPFLAATSPEGLFGLEWELNSEDKDTLVFTAYPRSVDGTVKADSWLVDPASIDLDGFDPNVLFRLKIDPRRSAPLSLEWYLGFKVIPADFMNKTLRAEDFSKLERSLVWRIEVRAYQQIANQWLPKEVIEEYFSGDIYIRIAWRLLEVKTSKPERLESLIPLGTEVADYRHCGEGYQFPPSDCRPVLYRWDGALPSIEKLRAATVMPPSYRRTHIDWRWIPPVLLVIVGMIWWMRTWRKNR